MKPKTKQPKIMKEIMPDYIPKKRGRPTTKLPSDFPMIDPLGAMLKRHNKEVSKLKKEIKYLDMQVENITEDYNTHVNIVREKEIVIDRLTGVIFDLEKKVERLANYGDEKQVEIGRLNKIIENPNEANSNVAFDTVYDALDRVFKEIQGANEDLSIIKESTTKIYNWLYPDHSTVPNIRYTKTVTGNTVDPFRTIDLMSATNFDAIKKAHEALPKRNWFKKLFNIK